MTAIDFTQLMHDAKRKSKARPGKSDDDSSARRTVTSDCALKESKTNDKFRTCMNPKWDHENDSSLAFSKLNLQKVCSNPKFIFYSNESIQDTDPLWKWLQSLPQGDSGLEEWKTMTYGKRNVCMFGERSSPLPPPLSILAQNLVQAGIFSAEQAPNHVLLNEYRPSQGILPHTDGPRYASRTATLSLGSDVVLEFTKRLSTDEIGMESSLSKQDDVSILLHANSLIVFEDDVYLHYCHGIAMDEFEDIVGNHCLNASEGVAVPRSHRFSLTFRHKFHD